MKSTSTLFQTSGDLYCSSDNLKGVQIFDHLGRSMGEQNIVFGKINLSNYPPGIYFCKYEYGNDFYSTYIIKQ